MNFEPASWNVLTVGAWNRAILTPEWIAKSIFKVPEGTPLPLEVPLNVWAPWKVKHEDCAVLVSASSLEIVAEKRGYETLEKARAFSVVAMQELPRTPLEATGFNIRYASDDEIDPDVAVLGQCEIDARLAECDLEIGRRMLQRSLSYGDGQLNFSMAIAENQTAIDFNFHKGSSDCEQLKTWLSTPMEEVQTTINSIIEKLGIIL